MRDNLLAGVGERRGGAKSCNGEKAWSSLIHIKLSGGEYLVMQQWNASLLSGIPAILYSRVTAVQMQGKGGHPQ